ncbi:uncharacterized protein LOC142233605 isoform X2 [Haematobia irritans]|uniref:uncharacterized protein LOC142233605 isoform X2 n=1 Tax=Haematobia irritans TaxID=7368 RepID=UPI003F5088F4
MGDNISEEEFLDNVKCDIQLFIERRHSNGVLLFPPVNNFRRFLIHQTCEKFRSKYDLFTFSVGQGPFRRTVVCFKSQLIDPQKYIDCAAATNFERRNKNNGSQLKNWRSENRHSEPLYFTNNNTVYNSKMGVERNLTDIKLNKCGSLDLYRPPALRNDGIDTPKRSASNLNEAQELASTSDATTTATTTSMSCNNSPIHRKENANSTVDITTSTKQNSLGTHEEVDGTPKAPPRQQQQTRRERRPDRAVYIPRARRSQTTPPTTTQIQQSAPAPSSVQITTPTVNGTTVLVTPTSSHTGKSLNQQLPITIDDTTAASVNEKPSSKADEVGKTPNSTSNTTTTTTKKREKLNKETRERREQQRASKKLLTAAQSNPHSKNNTKSNENPNKASDDEFSSPAVSLIAVCDTSSPSAPLVLESSQTAGEHFQNSVDKISQKTKVSDCDRDEEIFNESESVEILNQEELNPPTSGLANVLICNPDSNKAINEFFVQRQLLSEPTDTVSRNFANISNSLTNITNEFTTMPKSSNKAKHNNKASNAVDNAKMPNLRIEDVASQPAKCDIEEQELQRASKEINRSNRRIMKQTFVSDVLQIPDHIAEEEKELNTTVLSPTKTKEPTTTTQHAFDSNSDDDEDDWEKMYDDTGECIDPKIMQELAASVGKCKIELPKMDYSAFLTKQSILNDEEFPHVLEVSNFPVEFKNHDLLMIFSQYKESGFDIKWVDDTHALAVFSSSRIAAEVLTMGHPFVVLKPLAEATLESRVKAKKCAASLQPYRPRPETCAALARRLVTGALGVRLKTAAAERENEKRVLREAKERKLLAAKQRDEVWDS